MDIVIHESLYTNNGRKYIDVIDSYGIRLRIKVPWRYNRCEATCHDLKTIWEYVQGDRAIIQADRVQGVYVLRSITPVPVAI